MWAEGGLPSGLGWEKAGLLPHLHASPSDLFSASSVSLCLLENLSLVSCLFLLLISKSACLPHILSQRLLAALNYWSSRASNLIEHCMVAPGGGRCAGRERRRSPRTHAETDAGCALARGLRLACAVGILNLRTIAGLT